MDRVQNQEVADGLRDAKAGGDGRSVRIRNREAFPALEGCDDGTTPCSLHSDHPWPLRRDPTQLFHFVEGFPHSHQSGSSSCRVEDDIRKLPAELFSNFVPQRFLPFHPVWFL